MDCFRYGQLLLEQLSRLSSRDTAFLLQSKPPAENKALSFDSTPHATNKKLKCKRKRTDTNAVFDHDTGVSTGESRGSGGKEEERVKCLEGEWALYEGHPGRAGGHVTRASSYFDR